MVVGACTEDAELLGAGRLLLEHLGAAMDVDGLLDRAYTEWCVRKPRPLRRLRRLCGDWRAARHWAPGSFYLDHGSEPCVLIRLEDGDTLVGVSLRDGRIVGGCSIYGCGPVKVTEREAREKLAK